MSSPPITENHGSLSSASDSRRRSIAVASSSSQSNDPIDPVCSVTVAPHGSILTAAEVKSEASRSQNNAAKRAVWNSPSNTASEVGRVMGASSWPALSEANNKSSDSSSAHVSQGFANASVPPLMSAGRGYVNPTPNHSRHRSSKWNVRSSSNGASVSYANGGSTANVASVSYANGVSGTIANGASRSSTNGASGSTANGASGSTANGAVSQPSAQGSFTELPSHNRGQNQRNGYASQRGNQNGNHPRRNHEHGNQNWNVNRNLNVRDANSQAQRGTTPAFVRYPPPPPPPPVPLPMQQPIHPQFMAIPTIPPFGNHVQFHPDFSSMYYPRMPTFITPAQVFYHQQDLPLHIKIQNQIHYYFSEENLDRDRYLCDQMNEQGFVPLHLVAGFSKMTKLTDSIQQIVEALQGSPYVEVQGDGVRKRHNWQKWAPPRRVIPGVANPPQPVVAIANQVGNLSIGGSSSQVQPVESQNNTVSDGQQQQPI